MEAHIPSSIRRILRSVESQNAFLRCRGLDLPRSQLPDVYARFLVERTFGRCGPEKTVSAWNGSGRPGDGTSRDRERGGGGRIDGRGGTEEPRGYDVRDPGGVRYRVLGRKLERRNREVVVPGVPRRGFDRLVLVRFDSAYHVLYAGMTAAVDFLHASEYREEPNEWSLPLWDPFWSGGAVWDVTDVFRTAAAQVALEDAPFLEPWTPASAGSVRRPARRSDAAVGQGRRLGGGRKRRSDGNGRPASGRLSGGFDRSG